MIRYFSLDPATLEVVPREGYRGRTVPEIQDLLFDEVGDVRVSTIFLGFALQAGGVPLVFETMVFGGARDREQVHHGTYAEAKAFHDRMVDEVRGKP